MPYLCGGSLQDLLERRGRLEAQDAVDLFSSITEAIGLAHEKGIVHRDIKPANIIFDVDERPYVADLGLAKRFDKQARQEQDGPSLSLTGTAMGTPRYMAPEQMADAKTAGPRADVFSLGAMLYKTLSGQTIYKGGTVLEVAMEAARGQIPPIVEIQPD